MINNLRNKKYNKLVVITNFTASPAKSYSTSIVFVFGLSAAVVPAKRSTILFDVTILDLEVDVLEGEAICWVGSTC